MARRRRFSFRKRPKFMNVLVGVIMLALYGLVGTQLLSAIGSSIEGTTSPFVDGYALLGFNHTGDVVGGTVASTGLIGVLFIVAAAGVIISAFVKMNF